MLTPPTNPFMLARLRAGLDVSDVVRELDGSPSSSAIYCYERGETRPSAKTLRKLADLYGTTTDALLGLEPVRAGAERRAADEGSRAA